MARSRLRRLVAPVRARATLAATLVVGIAAVVAGIVVLGLLRTSMIRNVDALAIVRAADVAALVRSGKLTDSLASPFDEGSLVQVLDPAGRVIASSANVEGQGPIGRSSLLRAGPPIRTVRQLPIDQGSAFRLVVRTVPSSGGPVTVLVATSLGQIDRATGQVRTALALSLPVLLGVVAATTWVLMGRSLRPVESIRSQVAEISTKDLGRRVPVPGTGDEIERLARTMNLMLDRLETAQARQKSFVADASHELRSPIAASRAQLETALAHPHTVDWPSVAGAVLAEEVSMEKLVDQLLILARADERVLVRSRTDVDLRVVVLEEVRRMRPGDAIAVVASQVAAAHVAGDPDQLARVVRNLLDNALRHATSTVRIEVSSDAGNAQLTVADDGEGIPPRERARIFERFSRLDGARSRHAGGAGLGLAITKEIVEAHGGSITATDGAAGARFVVSLPLALA